MTDKTFVKELFRMNYVFHAGFAVIVVAGLLYYGGSATHWIQGAVLVGIIALALVVKLKRIKVRGTELDERARFIIYRALSVGFYSLIGVVLWYWTKEMVVDGHLSVRTYVELAAGLGGYVIGYLVLMKRY